MLYFHVDVHMVENVSVTTWLALIRMIRNGGSPSYDSCSKAAAKYTKIHISSHKLKRLIRFDLEITGSFLKIHHPINFWTARDEPQRFPLWSPKFSFLFFDPKFLVSRSKRKYSLERAWKRLMAFCYKLRAYLVA